MSKKTEIFSVAYGDVLPAKTQKILIPKKVKGFLGTHSTDKMVKEIDTELASGKSSLESAKKAFCTKYVREACSELLSEAVDRNSIPFDDAKEMILQAIRNGESVYSSFRGISHNTIPFHKTIIMLKLYTLVVSVIATDTVAKIYLHNTDIDKYQKAFGSVCRELLYNKHSLQKIIIVNQSPIPEYISKYISDLVAKNRTIKEVLVTKKISESAAIEIQEHVQIDHKEKEGVRAVKQLKSILKIPGEKLFTSEPKEPKKVTFKDLPYQSPELHSLRLKDFCISDIGEEVDINKQLLNLEPLGEGALLQE